ncbi:peptidyl-dipeptidase Dcp Metallo peptidase. MEROPS family M03A [Phyllobacterium sp. YR620]|uniref:M3 family metallopeptidase n=1 Tax=Phyllobacterium sp. YR620 TaxID=1881066 RepID=UPI00088C8C4C|nr:M3 family metallopeptidase [Phyllobacterium sp. YR620]SDP37918.1 peptidyl-dipeptidase Dcp Metallo peptidase. MEROPS family M03A [Phyllobacterium sp. YR620]
MSTQKPAFNHALTNWTGPLGLPDFTAFNDDDFAAAFDAALISDLADIDAIVTHPEAPTIDNTLKALQLSGKDLDHVSAIFWLRAGAHTNDTIQALERVIAPKMSRHASSIMMNPHLFARIDSLFEQRDLLGLDAETDRVLEKTWKGFVRSGAKLDEQGKARLADINERLASLGAQFGQNVLKDEADWALFITDEAELAGLPDFVRDAMRGAAEERGRNDAWAVTLSRSIIEPFLSFSENRNLREKAFRAWAARGENGAETDNTAIVAEMVKLRAEKAGLLGYKSFAAYKLDDTMAKTPKAVMDLLEPVWEKAKERAAEEEVDLQRLIAGEGRNHRVEPWDWRYYAEKLRNERFAFDETELKRYLQLEKIIEACFDVATRLFGIRFAERTGIPTWHPDVRVWEVFNPDGSKRGLFLGDYFNRQSKRSGAWMSALQSQHKLDGDHAPIIYNVMNFAKPSKGEPALLSLDGARTLFHEFGHALHGLLSDVTWPAVSGTSVSRDFVELPSQLYEHWLTVPAILEKYAVHYRTGEAMPKALLDKVLAANTFNAGFNTVEFTSSALVDMAFHADGTPPSDPIEFEAATLKQLEMPDAIIMRHRTPHFTHVFSGDGYSAGYYSYMWSEVLDADAFKAFEESGDVFNSELADKLKQFIYSSGGSRDPEELYKAFRGKMPTPDAMIEKRGLA